eukprot:TRINITY_DN1512_c0_g1_i1.p1 TRINITY_DN1512_c0_g1~~TRINITY_DN1512_c0_g1_i1.p1  ORF type:complete len:1022 (-),score=354.41 TRINITY_DN1512_c0_g1_i1:140-3205(-)
MAPKPTAEQQARVTAFDKFKNVHMEKPSDVAKFAGTNMKTGLTPAQVEEYREIYGRNEFPATEGTSLLVLILKQFEDTLVIILILAAVVSFALAFLEEGGSHEATSAFVEPLVIVLILVANATVGVMQESSAEKAVEALKAYESPHAVVLRGGRVNNIDATELVVGDVVEVAVGDLVPADIRVVERFSSTLDVAQEMLTGEAYNVEKVPDAIDNDKAQLQDKKNILFSGTNLTRGKLRGVVIGTGIFTEKGKIREQLVQADDVEFPLKKKLDDFGALLSKAIAVICVVVWAINIGHFSDPAFGGTMKGAIYYFKIAVSLAVAAIPEGLPAVVTTCLALGTQRMAAKNAIVTVLPAVETLGCTSVICSDKTGTLTTNQMSVRKFFALDDEADCIEFAVEGVTYEPIKSNGKAFSIMDTDEESPEEQTNLISEESSIDDLARVCALCNDAAIAYQDGKYGIVGQSTEASMRVLVERLGQAEDDQAVRLSKMSGEERANAVSDGYAKEYKKLFTFEFNRDRKSMSVLVDSKKNGLELLVKGAWDNVLGRCTQVQPSNSDAIPMTDAMRELFTEDIMEYCTGSDQFRCLVVAKRVDLPFGLKEAQKADPASFVDFEQDLIFIGCVAILDPPRAEVKPAIAKCRRAGIEVIVITGDNIATATSVCRAIGVFGPDEDVEGKAYTGAQFKAMSDTEKIECVKHARLFARVEPIDKKNLVDCLHKLNKVVAMTGDGVNDAPALKAADIGIAMGTGTAVAKGAAEMILADDNFTTIVSAVEEGRNIYNNTKQFIRYLICSNIGEVVAIFVCAVLGLPEILLPIQLLWVNLVTDGLPAIALGFNRPEDGIMNMPPRKHDEPIVSGFTFFRYMVTGTYIGLATVFGMVWWYMYSVDGPQVEYERLFEWGKCDAENGDDCSIYNDRTPGTISLSILVTIEMFCAINSLSEKNSLISASHPFSNPYLLLAMFVSFGLHFVILYVPYLAGIFSVVPIGVSDWVFVLSMALPVLLIDEILKVMVRAREPQVKFKYD